MTPWLRRARLAMIAAVLPLLGAVLLAHLLLTPASGSLLVLLTAKQPDLVASADVAIHSSTGWHTLGRIRGQPVPAAPDTANGLSVTVPAGSYDALRWGSTTLQVRISVRPGLLTPVLVAIRAGEPLLTGVYTGSESVSLGLNELAGQLKPMPSFDLVDQLGRPFSNASIAGHSVLLAAFHTTCHESCPIVTGLFLQLRKQLPPSVLLIEATTDPGYDTPQVLREFAGRVGASWTFLTGDPAAMAAFWKPFDVELSTGDVHRTVLSLIDAHGYIRIYFLGTPDVLGQLPEALKGQLNGEAMRLLQSRGDGWGAAQVTDALASIGGLSSPATAGEGEAPDFTLSSLDGQRVSLHDLRGRPVLINFWATYCAPCRREMPLIEREAGAHRGAAVLLVDELDDAGAARRFVSDLHVRSTVLSDADGAVGQRYRVAGLPTTVFVRADGSVEGRYVGETNQQILERHLAAVGA